MTQLRRTAAAAFRDRGPALLAAGHRAARLAFLARTKAAAALHDSHVALDVHPAALISPGALVEVWPHTHTAVTIGAGATLGRGSLLSLRGGTLTIGRDSQVRRLVTLQVTGDLCVGNGVVLSTGMVVHCAESVRIGDLTIIGEHSTIADSAHVRTAPDVPVHHASRTAPVVIGSNCWLGASVVVASGVTVGDQCFVGAHSVVTRDVESGWLATGVPAKPVRRLETE
ncbi:MAG: maltose O-acetyltransferase [Frankiales bacterium]|jgi:acetyltransferase-like isoleucine patch superfamily enzyme|nr:maltose O-acetyltransferase [Frankiales bacterium]